MKYDAKACHFSIDTGCVELLLRDGRKISIDCTGVEDALDVTMAQRSELDYIHLLILRCKILVGNTQTRELHPMDAGCTMASLI